MTPTLAEAMAAGPVVLDGGLATHLEAMGHDLSTTKLWSARLLQDDPGAIVRAHADFFAAGARVATTATYQASFPGFTSVGLDRDDATLLMRRGVTLAVRARDEASGDGADRWVAASVGPYGAMLADGSEYRGDYGLSVAQLREWHRPRLAVLADAGADVLAIETIPCAAEVEALIAEIAGSGVPVWISVAALMRDGVPCTAAGEPLSDVLGLARGIDEVIAVGVNCCDPASVADLVRAATRAAGRPGVAYPNSGEAWNAVTRGWVGSGTVNPALVTDWRGAGAALIGGCCRVGPRTISAFSSWLRAA